MFDDIGGKIKTLAQVLCWIGIAVAVISGVIVFVDGSMIVGLLTIIIGSLASWLGSFMMYGFGQLVENSDAAAYRLEKLEQAVAKMQQGQQPAARDADAPRQVPTVSRSNRPWTCKHCSSSNAAAQLYCSNCGEWK